MRTILLLETFWLLIKLGESYDLMYSRLGERRKPPNTEVWQSPVYCNSLENCRSERVREFESHRFHQVKCIPGVMAASQSPKLLVGVRVPGGTPNNVVIEIGRAHV